MRKAWSKFPIAVEFRIFIFNVTNPLEVHQGAKPKVQEIGPYFFEWVISIYSTSISYTIYMAIFSLKYHVY